MIPGGRRPSGSSPAVVAWWPVFTPVGKLRQGTDERRRVRQGGPATCAAQRSETDDEHLCAAWDARPHERSGRHATRPHHTRGDTRLRATGTLDTRPDTGGTHPFSSRPFSPQLTRRTAGPGADGCRASVSSGDQEASTKANEDGGFLHCHAASCSNAEGGTRTLTPLRERDFESRASASSATSAVLAAGCKRVSSYRLTTAPATRSEHPPSVRVCRPAVAQDRRVSLVEPAPAGREATCVAKRQFRSAGHMRAERDHVPP